MLKSHVKFHSATGKRLILVADDEAINRELLGMIIGEEYEVLYAEDGREALEMIRENAEHLSIAVLDLDMPAMSGLDVLKEVRRDPALNSLPIIALTSTEEEKGKSLEAGAMDFIPKPFAHPKVVLTRIRKGIELYEDRNILQSTEREGQTGLFNKEFFFRYGEQYDIFHKDQPMDAVAVNINHFHLINEMYGRQRGDEVLLHLADYMKNLRDETGCIVSHNQADEFFMYVPSGTMDYKDISRDVNSHFDEFKDIKVRVRSGVYLDTDKSVDIERRFDRAVQASSMIRDDFSKLVSYYDESIHEKMLYENRLLTDVHDAIGQGQFYTVFQPKYDIRGDQPKLTSAEVLVRWEHPKFGKISPADFIPLLEKNGLVHELDSFVWADALRSAGEWKKQGIAIPLSINVSRMDLYNSHLVEDLNELMDQNGLDQSELYLEITESAYAEDREQVVWAVHQLHEAGYKLEIDDFGTGYSSLIMLADAPVDILKLDMMFVRNLDSDRQKILTEIITDIAKHLGFLVVAEGVETKEQVDYLKSVGCDIIQGYYFSKPLKKEDFEALLKKERGTA